MLTFKAAFSFAQRCVWNLGAQRGNGMLMFGVSLSLGLVVEFWRRDIDKQ